MQWKNEGLKTHDSQNCDSGYRPDISCKLMSNIRVANLSFLFYQAPWRVEPWLRLLLFFVWPSQLTKFLNMMDCLMFCDLDSTRGIKIQTCPVTKTLCVIGILKGVGWPAGTIVHCQKLTFSFRVCSCRYDRPGQSAFDKKGLKRKNLAHLSHLIWGQPAM